MLTSYDCYGRANRISCRVTAPSDKFDWLKARIMGFDYEIEVEHKLPLTTITISR